MHAMGALLPCMRWGRCALLHAMGAVLALHEDSALGWLEGTVACTACGMHGLGHAHRVSREYRQLSAATSTFKSCC